MWHLELGPVLTVPEYALEVVEYIAVQFHGDGDLIVALAGAQGAGAHPGRFCLLR